MKTRDLVMLGLFLIVTVVCYLPHAVDSFAGLDVTSYEPILLTPRPLPTALRVMSDFKGVVVPGYYAPLGSLSLIGDRLLAESAQATPRVTFVINLLLHCLTGLMLWWLLRSLGFSEAVALVSAFVFLVHPMQVPVVAWFAERKTVLAATWYLLCYALYVRAGFSGWTPPDPSASELRLTNQRQAEGQTTLGWQHAAHSRPRSVSLYVLSLVAFVMGLLTKPTVSVFPLAWMWGAVFSLKSEPGNEPAARLETVRRHLATLWAALVPLIPFFAAALLIGSIAFLSEPTGPPLPISERLPLVGASLLFYVHKVIAPVDLMYIYPRWSVDSHSVLWWLPFLGVSAASILLFRYRRRFAQSFTWGVGNFMIPLLPAAGLVSFGFFQHSYVANHLAYLSMAGAAVCMGSLFVAGVQRASMPLKALVIVFGALYAAFLVGQTWSQASLWQSPLKLWEDNVSRCPSCPTAHSGLGVVLINMGRYRDGLLQMEAALAGQPDSASDQHNVGQVKAYLGDFHGAMPYYQKAIQLKPSYAKAHNGLGVVFQALGDWQRSVDEFQRAVDLAPHLLAAQFNLAVARHQMGEFGRAITHYEEVLRLDPRHVAAHNNVGDAYLSLGQFEKAQAHFKKALEIRPDSEYALKNLEIARKEILKQQETSAVKPPEGSGPEAPSPK